MKTTQITEDFVHTYIMEAIKELDTDDTITVFNSIKTCETIKLDWDIDKGYILVDE